MPSDPQEIQREIEATRADLAATVEQIADRVSPKKVAARSAAAAKETARDTAAKAVDTAKDTAAKAKDAAEHVFTTPAPAAETSPAPLAQRLKWERVAAAGAGLVVLLALLGKIRGRDRS